MYLTALWKASNTSQNKHKTCLLSTYEFQSWVFGVGTDPQLPLPKSSYGLWLSPVVLYMYVYITGLAAKWTPAVLSQVTLISTGSQGLTLSLRVSLQPKTMTLLTRDTADLLRNSAFHHGRSTVASSPYLQSSFSSAPPNVYTFMVPVL